MHRVRRRAMGPGRIAHRNHRQQDSRDEACRVPGRTNLPAQKYRSDSRSSEFHAALRVGVGQLYTKIDRALKRVKDAKTSALLRELRAKLESVP